ncbi:cyclin-H1-1-like [Silene latifolia]|uniref:cyclin-H1-1-like n=1 Tax=Silene latifolia TaxID=37657 RepID=UPI003D77D616
MVSCCISFVCGNILACIPTCLPVFVFYFAHRKHQSSIDGADEIAFTDCDLCDPCSYGTTSLEIDADVSFSHPKRKRDSENNVDKHSSAKPLKVEVERMLHAFYENKIHEVCRAFFFPHKIQGIALIYYKRFYLHWSVMEHDPKYVMLTCVYLACKIEENHSSSEDLGKIIQLDHQLILDIEMLVLRSLGFDLIVYTPYRSIERFIDDMEDFCYSTGGQMDLLKNLHQKSFLEADKQIKPCLQKIFSAM